MQRMTPEKLTLVKATRSRQYTVRKIALAHSSKGRKFGGISLAIRDAEVAAAEDAHK